jgi:hypothetical protein
MAGYINLRKDFNVFIVGDAKLATLPASESRIFGKNDNTREVFPG